MSDPLSPARGCLYGMLGTLVILAAILVFADWVLHVVD